MRCLPSPPFDRDKFIQTFGMNNAVNLANLLVKPPDVNFLERVSSRKERRFR
jgi:hypothetical protein